MTTTATTVRIPENEVKVGDSIMFLTRPHLVTSIGTHDDRCESEWESGAMAYTPCGCAERVITEVVVPRLLSERAHRPR